MARPLGELERLGQASGGGRLGHTSMYNNFCIANFKLSTTIIICRHLHVENLYIPEALGEGERLGLIPRPLGWEKDLVLFSCLWRDFWKLSLVPRREKDLASCP